MDFRIADTFTDSLVRLTGEEQKAVKTTAFDLQINPANPGLSFFLSRLLEAMGSAFRKQQSLWSADWQFLPALAGPLCQASCRLHLVGL
jgi:hypothetical protein